MKTKSFAKSFVQTALATALMLAGASATFGWAQNVKITPLGSHAGELCDRDRATIFEDPTGVRLLYDAGQSMMGATILGSATYTPCCCHTLMAITSGTRR